VLLKINRYVKEIYNSTAFPGILIFLILIVINAIIQPGFFTYYSFKLNLFSFTPLILVSISQALVMLVGALDLSIGAAVSLLTVFMASVMGDSPLSIALALILALGAAWAMSLFNGFFISYLKLPPFLVTYASSAIWFGIALYIMPTPGGYIPRSFYKFYRSDFLGVIPIPVLILLGIGIIYFILSRLKIYKHIYAVGGKEEAAWASGIKIHATRIKAFLWSGFFVALAAICLVSETATGDARCGLGYTLNSVAAAVIGGVSFSGGKGSLAGAAVGGVILGLLINILYFANVTSFYQTFMKGIIVIGALVVGSITRMKEQTTS